MPGTGKARTVLALVGYLRSVLLTPYHPADHYRQTLTVTARANLEYSIVLPRYYRVVQPRSY
jgi:hypothetical protein